jgi:transcription elongation factor Elf1
MNFGDCPYCNDFTGMFATPDQTPSYAIVKCESCGKDIWYKFSRINPESWTIEDFEEKFIIDHVTHQIKERNPKPEPQFTDEEMAFMNKAIEDLILNGTGHNKPMGILNYGTK